ncbi:N-alpha-acetyltransferase 40-like [Oppia nitens]|uniref:N-alpha-acetyltransferase 40-like n=1 Tax=Oppia nitens TaxID=1686743 RepID=UPI0023DA4C27|nr:N-alpha-acetyltransferase 40-like [Oppia nitens]
MSAIKRRTNGSGGGQKGCRAMALISVANDCLNPLSKIVDQTLLSYRENQLNLDLECHRWPEMDDQCQQWIIQLTEDNMKTYYDESSNGWSRSNKLKEFRHKTSRHLVLRCADTRRLIAFVHFRFEVGGTDSESAVYCYELQVVASHQRLGIGRYLMSCLYAIGRAFNMHKVMLTVFKHNTIAMDFYAKTLKYRIDRSSPSRCQMNADYEILCLTVDKKGPQIDK